MPLPALCAVLAAVVAAPARTPAAAQTAPRAQSRFSAAERYRGETEPVDKRAGHIPGAVNAPFSGNLKEGRFRPPEELRALYERLGAAQAAEVVASCGSGVTACHTLLALELAGFPGAKLYVGSWSDWSSQPAASVATGPEPG